MRDNALNDKILQAFYLLERDPHTPALKSHKITRHSGKTALSSRVNADIRIIWDYHDGRAQILDILDIGGHSGSGKVYK